MKTAVDTATPVLQKPAQKSHSATTTPITAVPRICPPLEMALSRPMMRVDSPGRWLASVQLAGQKIARATVSRSCAANIAAKVSLSANSVLATIVRE